MKFINSIKNAARLMNSSKNKPYKKNINKKKNKKNRLNNRRECSETHSLFYRVYKSRYFPECSFMDAVLGSNPSYVWRSLLAARDVLKEGAYWRVGDGRHIGVLTHHWLPHRPRFLGKERPDLRVCKLIDSTTKQWDWEKIFDLFDHRT